MNVNRTEPTAPTDADPGQRFQILSLDGGGAKALFTARVLAHLEDDLNTSIADHFDLITGTSAGGIIALALGAGLSPADVVDRYERLAEQVFPKTRRRRSRIPYRLRRPTYDASELRHALTDVLGDRVLGDSSRRLVIPSWDLENGCVHLFKTPHHNDLFRDRRIPMVDVALATSAAPTFFSVARVDGHRLIDGGVWANNPTVIGIAEAVSLFGVPLHSVGVLNIGTTSATTPDLRHLDDAGWARWGRHVPDILITAASRGTADIAQHLLAGGTYLRVDADVPPDLVRLDSAGADRLEGRAADVSRKHAAGVRRSFLAHKPTPYHPHAHTEGVTS